MAASIFVAWRIRDGGHGRPPMVSCPGSDLHVTQPGIRQCGKLSRGYTTAAVMRWKYSPDVVAMLNRVRQVLARVGRPGEMALQYAAPFGELGEDFLPFSVVARAATVELNGHLSNKDIATDKRCVSSAEHRELNAEILRGRTAALQHARPSRARRGQSLRHRSASRLHDVLSRFGEKSPCRARSSAGRWKSVAILALRSRRISRRVDRRIAATVATPIAELARPLRPAISSAPARVPGARITQTFTVSSSNSALQRGRTAGSPR